MIFYMLYGKWMISIGREVWYAYGDAAISYHNGIVYVDLW
jgi:hypothetical protein